MSVLSHLSCVFVLGAGAGVPFALGSFGENDKWGEFVFNSTGGAKVDSQY